MPAPAHPPLTSEEVQKINRMINDGKTREEIYSYFGLRFEEMRDLWIRSIDTDNAGRGEAFIGGVRVRRLWAAHYKYHRAGITRKRREAIQKIAKDESIGIVLAKMFDRVCKEEAKVNATIEDHEIKIEYERKIAEIKRDALKEVVAQAHVHLAGVDFDIDKYLLDVANESKEDGVGEQS